MALISTKPILQNGRTYDKLAINMAFSPVWREDSVGIAAAIRLTPYADDNEGIASLDDQATPIVFADVTQENDEATKSCLNEISTAIQKYINIKGL
jgi:hypothetical protein